MEPLKLLLAVPLSVGLITCYITCREHDLSMPTDVLGLPTLLLLLLVIYTELKRACVRRLPNMQR